ncbi:hypothetical protein AMTRI_Chr13g118350 [Amborella trichopoda]|uniref:UspA domain-containing protein n=1 Tax=Amborella trichopoda TaxID=13333 RepID=W1P8Q3_AMBTC|nr:universal stress protein A-like protein [Amborella trichopoda]ERN03986.1 hypothetical protein AMTR_s00079p00131240 [Amborella trichopoda]|eukprot:XP_006842311.1 universal stress protein A-like protein [Amborella trichopoda]
MAEGEKKVMVAVDDSECNRYAFEWFLENLLPSLSTQLYVFHVEPLDNISYAYAASLGAAPPQLIEALQDQQRKITKVLVDKIKEICTKRSITAEIITVRGEPKDAICEAVEKYQIELLVLGSHGRGALQRAFLGSVSNYCVHHAKCPVLVVKKPKQTSGAS